MLFFLPERLSTADGGLLALHSEANCDLNLRRRGCRVIFQSRNFHSSLDPDKSDTAVRMQMNCLVLRYSLELREKLFANFVLIAYLRSHCHHSRGNLSYFFSIVRLNLIQRR